jgi:glycosyltransferase involved in cell wall biosynthesis
VSDKKLVSVNITTYNRANLLSKCLESVLKQSYPNLEVVIVNDCSTDNTEKIIKDYQQNDKRIKYYKHNINKGNAAARNTALKYSAGFYVAFLDDDDEWIDKDKLKKQVVIFENSKNNNLGIICSGILRHKGSGEGIIQKALHPKDIKYEVLKGGLIHNSTVLTKRSIMEKVGGFDLKVSRGVDSEFFRRLIVIFNYSVFFMDDITCKYFENSPHSMSGTYTADGCIGKINSQYINIKKYFWFLLIRPKILFLRLYILINMQIKYLLLLLKNNYRKKIY